MGLDGSAWVMEPDAAENLPQGISADLIATKFGYSRNDVDSFAVTSQKRLLLHRRMAFLINQLSL
jgi:acetyl-CoA C-acetyltransferase